MDAKFKSRIIGITGKVFSKFKLKPVPILIAFLFILILSFFTYFFMFYFFPYNKLKKPIENYAGSNLGIKLKISSIYPSFPFNINLKGVNFIKENGNLTADSSIVTFNASPFILYYMLIKKIPVDIYIQNIKFNSINSGFFKIPGFSLNLIHAKILFKEGKKGELITGNINFRGDINGTAGNISVLYDKIIKINHAVIKIKPQKPAAKKFMPILSAIFKKGGNGYYIYIANNLFL